MACKTQRIQFPILTLGLSTTLVVAAGCRAKTEKPIGVAKDGTQLEQALPKDSRLFELFKAVSVIDFTKEPSNNKKCNYNFFELDPVTKAFPANASPDASRNTFTYDSTGRKTRQIYEYGSASTRSKSLNTWIYDTAGRISKTTSGRIGADGTETVASNCTVTYEGSSERVTRHDCFTGTSTEETEKTSSVEITYDLTQNKRTITEKRIQYSSTPPALRISSKKTEEHADIEFSFPLNSTIQEYEFSPTTNEDRLKSETVRVTTFTNNQFSSLQEIKYNFEGATRKKYSEIGCNLSTGLVKCSAQEFNTAEEAYRNTQTELTPILTKRHAVNIGECASPNECDSGTYSKNWLDFLSPIIHKIKEQGIDGKKDSAGESPNKSSETKRTYVTPYRPWMLSEGANSEESLFIDSDGKYGEVRFTNIVTQNGDVITFLGEARKNNGTATSREALGDFENSSKSETKCERN